jgi:hypothetical protein
MKALLEQYAQVTNDIFEAFGIQNGYGEIDDRTDYKWSGDSETVRWTGSDGEIYANDVLRGPVFAENFALFYVDNSCGEQFYQIFDTNLKDDEIESDY